MAEVQGADAIGVVVYADSPRAVTPERAGEIFSTLGPFTARVVVTGNISDGELEKILALGPSAIQVPVDWEGNVDARLLRMHAPGDPIRTDCDAIVIDGSRGSGRIYDCAYARSIVNNSPVPVILAGGLLPENVREAIRVVRPYAVDVSSGVEVSPGVKDHEKMRLFLRACRKDAE
jgi:phosphoribosylanthranilate isomerase